MKQISYHQEDKYVLHFEGQPIRIIRQPVTNNVMFNLVDIGRIIGRNPFKFMEGEEIKEAIKIYEKVSEEYQPVPTEENIVKIESTDEVYVHPLLAFQITWPDNLPLHFWCEKVSFDDLEENL